jgi:hypothetical protein
VSASRASPERARTRRIGRRTVDIEGDVTGQRVSARHGRRSAPVLAAVSLTS